MKIRVGWYFVCRRKRQPQHQEEQAPAAAPAAGNGAAQVGGGDRGREGDWTTHLLSINLTNAVNAWE